jgi:hypothetical protein
MEKRKRKRVTFGALDLVVVAFTAEIFAAA